MKVKIRYAITIVLAAVAITMATLSVPVLKGFGEVAAAGEPAVETHEPDLQMSEPVPYMLRYYRGKVAVFTPESGNEPAVILDINFDSLREVDKQMLRRGIGVREPAALALLLEDFGS